MEDPKTKRPRSGVEVSDILTALKNPLNEPKTLMDYRGRPGQKFIGINATVTINPGAGELIQCNPTDSDLVKRLKRRI